MKMYQEDVNFLNFFSLFYFLLSFFVDSAKSCRSFFFKKKKESKKEEKKINAKDKDAGRLRGIYDD